MAACWIVLELKEKNSILDRGLNLNLQLYVLSFTTELSRTRSLTEFSSYNYPVMDRY